MGQDEPEKPEEEEPEEGGDRLEPVEEEIPEPPDNLRKREEWFRKRSGRSTYSCVRQRLRP